MKQFRGELKGTTEILHKLKKNLKNVCLLLQPECFTLHAVILLLQSMFHGNYMKMLSIRALYFLHMVSDLVANMARREEKVAASSFRAFSSFLSFIMVSVTIDFSASYLLFRLARATSAVWIITNTYIS